MNKNKKPVWEEISETLEEIKIGLENSSLTNEEIDNLEVEFLKVELQAYKTKLSFEAYILLKENPTLSSKDLLSKMLSLLPSDIPRDFLPELTNFVLEEWDTFSKKMAA